MRIRVRLFAILRDQLGLSQLDLDLPDNSTVQAALLALRSQHPQLDRFLDRAACAVNQEYAPDTRVLHDQDELALIPPVSGG